VTGVTSGERKLATEEVQEAGDQEGEESQEDHEPEDVAQDREEAGRRLVFRVQPWIPWDASQRSASIAALHPSPAAETAWR
jgi:hypothetical protein